MAERLKLALIIGTAGEGRFGEILGHWLKNQIDLCERFSLDVIGLLEPDAGAQLVAGDVGGEGIERFRQRIAAADAFLIVTPEYNHGYPASLKHAIDQTGREWAAKPVAFASYGGMSGGLRAVEQLRQVFVEMHAVNVREGLSFHGARQTFGEDGQPIELASTGAAAQAMFRRIAWWAEALKQARSQAPYWD
jgi:NAD(P)H-dependent FMN reductase